MTTVVFGLDGADPELVERWMDDLPNFRRLKKHGFIGTLESIEPPITVPAWMSMYSSVEPWKYGCYDFKHLCRDYSLEMVNSSYFRGETYLENENVISFRVPGTTPGFEIDGYMVSGFIASEQSEFFPDSLKQDVEDRFDFDLDPIQGSKEEKLESASSNFEQNFELYRWLLEEKEFDTAYSVFRLIDTYMHRFDNEEGIKKSYVQADEALGELIDLCEENGYNLLVVSDHGSVQVDRKLYLNTWLEREGYLEYDDSGSDLLYSVAGKMMNLGLKPLVKTGQSLLSRTGKSMGKGMSSVIEDANLEESRAFCYISGVSNYGAVWINDGRFEKGNVEEREELAEEIAEKLEEEEFILKADLKWLEKDDMPDIIVRAEENIVVGSESYPSVFHRSNATVHGMEGLIAGKGPDIKNAEDLEANLLDVGASIEALNGKESLNDGEVIEEIVDVEEREDRDSFRGIDL